MKRFYHSREEALKHVATEMRILRHKDDTEHAVHMEKRQWHAYDFITETPEFKACAVRIDRISESASALS